MLTREHQPRDIPRTETHHPRIGTALPDHTPHNSQY
jgi:hypothetical protein